MRRAAAEIFKTRRPRTGPREALETPVRLQSAVPDYALEAVGEAAFRDPQGVRFATGEHPGEDWMTADELCIRLGVARAGLYDLVRRGHVTWARAADRLYYRSASVPGAAAEAGTRARHAREHTLKLPALLAFADDLADRLDDAERAEHAVLRERDRALQAIQSTTVEHAMLGAEHRVLRHESQLRGRELARAGEALQVVEQERDYLLGRLEQLALELEALARSAWALPIRRRLRALLADPG